MGDKLAVNKAKAEVMMASAFCYEKMKNGKNARRKADFQASPRGRGTAAEDDREYLERLADAVAVVGVIIRTLYQNSRAASPFMDGLAVPTQRKTHDAIER